MRISRPPALYRLAPWYSAPAEKVAEEQTGFPSHLAGFETTPPVVLTNPSTELAIGTSTPIIEMDHNFLALIRLQGHYSSHSRHPLTICEIQFPKDTWILLRLVNSYCRYNSF